MKPNGGSDTISLEDEVLGFASRVAQAEGGALLKKPGSVQSGVFVETLREYPQTTAENAIAVANLLFQSEHIHFPLAEEELELGTANSEAQDQQRDFPRVLKNDRRTVYQYPLFVAGSQLSRTSRLITFSSPYFSLLRNLLQTRQFEEGKWSFLAVDVAKVFAVVGDAEIANGELSVRSGRMVVKGIDYLRSAVFYGDNVILSPLYTMLVDMDGVSVHPKNCRLQRQYHEPVGASRRSFICWFDPMGNFKFTPGHDSHSAIRKFAELFIVLNRLKLIRNAESRNPLLRIGPREVD